MARLRWVQARSLAGDGMSTYQFDFTVITDGDTEGEALEEAMQLLADYRFATEAATVTLLAERRAVRCPDTPGEIVGCGHEFEFEFLSDYDGMVDCPKCGICFDPDYVGSWTQDEYGRFWQRPGDEPCPECGQPDNCGDCNHEPLTDAEVLDLGGRLR